MNECHASEHFLTHTALTGLNAAGHQAQQVQQGQQQVQQGLGGIEVQSKALQQLGKGFNVSQGAQIQPGQLHHSQGHGAGQAVVGVGLQQGQRPYLVAGMQQGGYTDAVQQGYLLQQQGQGHGQLQRQDLQHSQQQPSAQQSNRQSPARSQHIGIFRLDDITYLLPT